MAGKNYNDRLLAAKVRTKALRLIEQVLDGEETEYRKQIVLKLAGTVLPRLNEHTGEDGEKLFPAPLLAGKSNDSANNSNKEITRP